MKRILFVASSLSLLTANCAQQGCASTVGVFHFHWKQLIPTLPEKDLLLLIFVVIVVRRVQARWTAWIPMAPQVHVSLSCGSLRTQIPHHSGGVMVQKLVIMPRELMRMHENAYIREVFVLVDDVAQIDHDLIALILGGMRLRFAIIDRVYRGFEYPFFDDISQFLIDPSRVLTLQFRHNQSFCVSTSGWLGLVD